MCDAENPLAHTETFPFPDLVGTEFAGSMLSEDHGFGFYNNDFDNLMDIPDNDVLMLCNSDDDPGGSSPGRTMDLVYHLEDTGSQTKPDIFALVSDTDKFTRYKSITQGTQGSSQTCWPTKLAARRYIRAYFGSFQKHIPLLHVPTYLAHQCSEPLQLAIYAIGALHVYNETEARRLYRAGHEAFLAQKLLLVPVERLQTLLLLTMFGSLSDDDDLREEILPLQSQLAEELHNIPKDVVSSESSSWDVWVQRETLKRTILNIVCFLGVMNVASLSSSIFLPPSFDIEFPYSETLFLCNREEEWEYLFSSAPKPQTFKIAFHNLTSLSGPVLQIDSGLGNLVLMLALYTHVRSCKTVSASLPILLGREIIETSTLSLKRWLSSLGGPGVACQNEQTGADCSLTASALILWKVATIQLYADFASVTEIQDAILALSTGQHHTISALHTIQIPTHTAEAMGHAVSFVHGPVVRGVQFLKATACADICIYHGLMGFHCLVLLVRWLSSLESASKATGDQCTHPDALLLLQNIRELVGESDQPSMESLPLSAACAKIWVEILKSDRQIWG
ncbi:hypothetical protein AAEP93_003563 [Penicillium crustosum]